MQAMARHHYGWNAITTLGLVLILGGCPANTGNPDPPAEEELAVDIVLSTQARFFDVSGGEPVQQTDNAFVDLNGSTATAGTISLDPAAITATPAASAKLTVLQQMTTREIQITVWIGSLDLATGACQSGDQYGPFTVTIDQTASAIGVQPSSVPLLQSTIDLLPQFIVCIEVDVAGAVYTSIDIASLALRLDAIGQGALCITPGDCPVDFSCKRGRCVEGDSGNEMQFDEDNFPDCANLNSYPVDPGDIFCRSDAMCPAELTCCTGPDICRSNPCSCLSR